MRLAIRIQLHHKLFINIGVFGIQAGFFSFTVLFREQSFEHRFLIFRIIIICYMIIGYQKLKIRYAPIIFKIWLRVL